MTTMTTFRRVTMLCIAGLLPLAAPPRAAAQYTNTYTFRQFNNPMSAYLDMRLAQRMQERRLQERILERSGQSGETRGTTAPAAPSRPISATDFRSTGTRLLPRTLAEATPDLTAEQKDQLRTLYLETLNQFEQQARKNNVAWALTFLLGISLQVVNDREVTEADTDRLALELNDVLASSPEFQSLTARKKQSLYEAAIITGGMIGVIHQLGVDQSNDQLKEQAKELAKSAIGQLLGAPSP